MAGGSADYPACLRLAAAWRQAGRRVVIEVRDGNPRGPLQLAHRQGIPEVLVVESAAGDELTGTLREMISGQERPVTLRLTQ